MTRENGPNHAPLRTWLITGASSGLGHALAECVLSHGDQVVLTAPTLSGMEALAARHPAPHSRWSWTSPTRCNGSMPSIGP